MRITNVQRIAGVTICMSLLAGCAVQHAAPAPQVTALPVFPPPPEQPRLYYERALRTSADVEPDTKDESFRRYVTGEQRSGEALAKPYGVAAHAGRLYVGDTVRRAVFVFDFAAQRVQLLGTEEPGRLLMPLGLDVAPDGELYVVDATRHAVLVFDAQGRYRREFGGPQQLRRPAGIAVASIAGQLRAYVVDAAGVESSEHRVSVFDAVSGGHLFDFGTRGPEPGQLNLPRDVAVAANGEVYVVDGGNFRVQVFDADGRFLRGFGDIGRQGGQFSRPKELAIDPSGNVYVVDAAFGNFQIFNAQGQLLLDVGYRSNADRPAGFMLPAGIAVDADGRVFVADQFFRKVEVFSPVPPAAAVNK